MVHGNCVSIGCYAMEDKYIERIYLMVDAALRNGQDCIQVHAFPFPMTESNLSRYENSEWIEFWRNLREGYERFEQDGFPPVVTVEITVEGPRYVFQPGTPDRPQPCRIELSLQLSGKKECMGPRSIMMRGQGLGSKEPREGYVCKFDERTQCSV